jgi:hypothetical protein
MNRRTIQINELVKRMHGYNYMNLNTGEYIPLPTICFREDDLKDLIPVPESGLGLDVYKDPKALGTRTWVYRQVPDIYFQRGAWYDMPIPYTIYEPAVDFHDNDLKDLIPVLGFGYKNTYRNSKTGTYYNIPDYYFQEHAFANLILIPHYSDDGTGIKIKFLNKAINQYPQNQAMLQEINQLFTFADDQHYLTHEFNSLLSGNNMHEEWCSFAKEEEKVAHEQMSTLAIQWCEKNGLEYSLDE